ncbi:hypothetical protein RA210_U290004 [Rubrivivax sp. A210]|uniref:hypothetical protein n=1 Tax=Rubrivivax sp. A210 TaxID=2772301 RepID=UPI001919B8C0|nr:hypothetical protein [Rubrivivax sp. A210]CAD5373063.1 hypothetical protein RA210_U290004 [Rubrivivax sp. A210]
MEALKIFLGLTPLGYAVFLAGLAISGAALLYLRAPPQVTPPSPPSTPVPVPGPVPVTVVVNIENWQRSASPVRIVDSAGRHAEIEAIVLSNDFNWSLESHSKVERHGDEASVVKHLLTPGISNVIAGYAEVVAVGAASSEGAEVNPAAEDDRASRRADQLQLWIKEYVPSSKALYSLSLGHFRPGMPSDGDFSAQRRIVIVGVVRSDPGFELSGALYKDLGKVPGFPFDFQNYSEFKLVRRR